MVLVCLECREENRPLSGQQHQAQIGINPALLETVSRRFLERLGLVSVLKVERIGLVSVARV